MKNFFEFFGFLSMACISAALIFIFIGKKDVPSRDAKGGFLTELGADARPSDAPQTISDRPRKMSGDAGRKTDKAARPDAAVDNEAIERDLKNLYNDRSFIANTVKQWQGLVKDAADEYSVSPQVLLAHVLVQAYISDYSRAQLYNDASRHAGERVKPLSTALKGYRYGWTMQKLLEEHQLGRYFREEAATLAASVVAPKKSNAKSEVAARNKQAQPIAKTNAVEEGFKNMVAKEYGFASWAGMQKLADPDTKSEAARRVKSLMLAARVR